MEKRDVIEVLDRLDVLGVEVCVDGGWGVDALVGRQTRRHKDLDLRVTMSDLPAIERALPEFRRTESDEWPRFLILEDDRGRVLDLDLREDEHHWTTTGRVHGRTVRCLALEDQLPQVGADDADALRAPRPL